VHSIPSSSRSGRSGKSVKLVGPRSSNSSIVNVSTVSLADLDDSLASNVPVAEAIAQLSNSSVKRGHTPDMSGRPPRISEDRAKPEDGEAGESSQQSDAKQLSHEGGTSAYEEQTTSSLLPFEFPALRAFLGT